ncbi:MAG: hypothetical protein H7255_17230 [Ramlibacter sp.]|nr:hypothetical protein [Ramlibacter sp.]
MSDPDPRFATSSRPVNRRTAGRRDPLVPPPSNPAMQGRLAAVRARTQLGRALLEQVRTGAAIQQAPLKALTIVASIVMTAGAAALFFALLESSILLGALGCVGLLAGGLMAWRGQRNDNALQAQRAAPLFDNASLTSLDRVLEEVAPELPQDTAAQLVDFKQLIVRLARQGAVAADEHFTVG